MTCINCSTESEGTFCPGCGQRLNVKRLTFKEGWQDFWARIYGFDGMFPRTLRDLTIRPGVAARKFIDGNRVAYYGPVGYFFLMITFFLLVLSMLGLDYVDFIKGVQKSIPIQQAKNEITEVIQRFAADNLKLIAFLVIPFQAFSARFVFFRKSGYNFIENTVLPFFAMGHLYWFTILSAVYYKLTGNLLNSIFQTTVSILFVGFAYTTFITYQSKVKVFFKGILLYIFSQTLMALVFIILIIIAILVLAVFNPEALKTFKEMSH